MKMKLKDLVNYGDPDIVYYVDDNVNNVFVFRPQDSFGSIYEKLLNFDVFNFCLSSFNDGLIVCLDTPDDYKPLCDESGCVYLNIIKE